LKIRRECHFFGSRGGKVITKICTRGWGGAPPWGGKESSLLINRGKRRGGKFNSNFRKNAFCQRGRREEPFTRKFWNCREKRVLQTEGEEVSLRGKAPGGTSLFRGGASLRVRKGGGGGGFFPLLPRKKNQPGKKGGFFPWRGLICRLGGEGEKSLPSSREKKKNPFFHKKNNDVMPPSERGKKKRDDEKQRRAYFPTTKRKKRTPIRETRRWRPSSTGGEGLRNKEARPPGGERGWQTIEKKLPPLRRKEGA